MKRNFGTRMFVLILSFWVVSSGFSQIGIRKSIRGGYSWSHFSGDFSVDQQRLKTWMGGLALEIRLLGTFTAEAGIQYSTKGTVAEMLQKNVEIRMNCISFPVVAKYTFFPVFIRPYILGGVEFGTILSAKNDGKNIKEDIRTRDKNWIAGCGAEFSLFGKGVFVEGRMRLSGQDLFKDPILDSVQDRSSQIILGILF